MRDRRLPRRRIHPYKRAPSIAPHARRAPWGRPSTTNTPSPSKLSGSYRGICSSIDDNFTRLDVYGMLSSHRSISSSDCGRFCIPFDSSCFISATPCIPYRPQAWGDYPSLVHTSHFGINLYTPSCLPLVTYYCPLFSLVTAYFMILFSILRTVVVCQFYPTSCHPAM